MGTVAAGHCLCLPREISLDRSLLDYLEALCCRAYLAVYAPQQTLQGLIWRFYSAGAPQAMRRSGIALLLAFLSFAIGSITGYALFLEDPTWFNTIVPSGLAGGRGLASSKADLLAVIYPASGQAIDHLSAFAGFLFSHNTQIAFFAFALGVFVCVPSTILAFANGLIIGAFFGLHVDREIGIDLLGWLSIHGVTEIGAIIVATAGGYRLGLAVLFPGRRTRRDALRHEGRDAAKLAVMAGTMLVAAALLEGFARQLITGLEARLVIGWTIGGLWAAYFLLAGRLTPAGREGEPT